MVTQSPVEMTLLAENAELRARLEEAEETLQAIRSGEIDALVVQSQTGPQIYTLQGLDAELNRFRGEILERISESIIVVDADQHIVYLNTAAEKLYGTKAMAILGCPLTKLIQNEWLNPNDEAAMHAALLEIGFWKGEALHQIADGNAFHAELLVTRLPKNNHPHFRDIIVIRDISERKRGEELLRLESLRQAAVLRAQQVIATAELERPPLLRLILDIMTELTGAEGVSLEMVEGSELVYEAATGLAEAFVGLRLNKIGSLSGLCVTNGKLLRADDIENDSRVDRDACRRIGIRSMVVMPLRYGVDLFGVLKLMSSRVAGFGEAVESTLRLMAEFLGATIARQSASQALAESESRFRDLADNISQLAWMADKTGSIFWYNRRWYEYTGTTLQEMEGWGWKSVHHPEHRDRVVRRLQKSWDTGEPWEDTFPLRSKEGNYRWFLSRALPICDDQGKILRWFGTHTDVTEQLEMEQALIEADLRKNDFLATLAHELRNPLAPISNGLHILQMPNVDSAVVKRVYGMMERQVNHMVRLVDELMEVSRINRGMIELSKTTVDLAEVLQQAVETSRPLIDAGRHRLSINLPAETLLLEADPLRLTQMIANLLNNAAKYTPENGHIWLSAWREGANAIISVRDNGIGIPSEMLPKVFDLFTQVDRSSHRIQGGLGIGLTLVQYLTKLHGGSIEVNSDGPNKGSEFVLRLPLAMESPYLSETDQNAEPPVNLASHRVLVVDDNPDVADSQALLLRQLQADVLAVYGGPAALQSIKTYRPSVVLIDIGMQGMDGYEVAQRIRQQPDCQHLTLIALTGWDQEEDRRKSKEAGFDHHLVKPVDMRALTELLASLPAVSDSN